MKSGLKFIIDPEKETVWATGWMLTGYTFTKKDDGWLLTIKVCSQSGVNKVAFITAPEIASCYELWYSAMTTTSIKLKWRDDRYKNVKGDLTLH